MRLRFPFVTTMGCKDKYSDEYDSNQMTLLHALRSKKVSCTIILIFLYDIDAVTLTF